MQKFEAPIKLVQPFPAPELRTRILRTRGFFWVWLAQYGCVPWIKRVCRLGTNCFSLRIFDREDLSLSPRQMGHHGPAILMSLWFMCSPHVAHGYPLAPASCPPTSARHHAPFPVRFPHCCLWPPPMQPNHWTLHTKFSQSDSPFGIP